MSFIEWLSGHWGQGEQVILSFDPPKPFIPLPSTGLKFCMENLNRRTSAYSAMTEDTTQAKYFRDLHKAAATGNESLYGVITSEIEGKFVMTLDCDGTDEMLAVCNILKSYYRLNYAVIVSSPGHYWVIADKVGTSTELLELMEVIPGIDSRYVDCIRNKCQIVLRGFPKDCMPIFPDEIEFTDKRVARWYGDFKKAWESDEMSHILRLRQLSKAIKEKKVAALAASPNFAV